MSAEGATRQHRRRPQRSADASAKETSAGGTPVVVAAVGRPASGKDELACYLRDRCGFSVVSTGDRVRELARREGIAPDRESLRRFVQAQLSERGEDFLACWAVEQIRDRGLERACVTGIRTPTDVRVLRQAFGDDLVVVHVSAPDPRVRYGRARRRNERRDPEDFEEFLRQDEKEAEEFHLLETFRRADLVLPNEGRLEGFHTRIRKELLGRIRCPEPAG